MAIIASERRASDSHARVLLPSFFSRLSLRLSPEVSDSVSVCEVAFDWMFASHLATVLSFFAFSTFARFSLRLLASCLSRIRLRSGGVPVVLSGGCVVSKISVTRSVASSLVSTLSCHASSHSVRNRSARIDVLSERWLLSVVV